jgi:hypothetical protein
LLFSYNIYWYFQKKSALINVLNKNASKILKNHKNQTFVW